MKNTIEVDKDRLEMAISYYMGYYPTDEEIINWVMSDSNICKYDVIKLTNQVIMRLGYKYQRDKIDSINYGLCYPQEFVKTLLADFTEHAIKTLKESNRV